MFGGTGIVIDKAAGMNTLVRETAARCAIRTILPYDMRTANAGVVNAGFLCYSEGGVDATLVGMDHAADAGVVHAGLTFLLSGARMLGDAGVIPWDEARADAAFMIFSMAIRLFMQGTAVKV
jgi:hypothetical protein